MNNITDKANKDDIIDCAVECIDTQQYQIQELTEQRNLLWTLLAALTVIHIIF